MVHFVAELPGDTQMEEAGAEIPCDVQLAGNTQFLRTGHAMDDDLLEVVVLVVNNALKMEAVQVPNIGHVPYNFRVEEGWVVRDVLLVGDIQAEYVDHVLEEDSLVGVGVVQGVLMTDIALVLNFLALNDVVVLDDVWILNYGLVVAGCLVILVVADDL